MRRGKRLRERKREEREKRKNGKRTWSIGYGIDNFVYSEIKTLQIKVG